MKTTMSYLFAIVLVLPLLAVCGCDGGGDDAEPTVNVTGTWKGTSTFSGSTSSETLNLVQNGSDVTGTDQDGVSYSGKVSGNTLSLVASVSNGADNMSLDVSGPVEGNSMVLSGTVKGTVSGTNVDGPITFNLSR